MYLRVEIQADPQRSEEHSPRYLTTESRTNGTARRVTFSCGNNSPRQNRGISANTRGQT